MSQKPCPPPASDIYGFYSAFKSARCIRIKRCTTPSKYFEDRTRHILKIVINLHLFQKLYTCTKYPLAYEIYDSYSAFKPVKSGRITMYISFPSIVQMEQVITYFRIYMVIKLHLLIELYPVPKNIFSIVFIIQG